MKQHIKYMIDVMVSELIKDKLVKPHLSAGVVIAELTLRGVEIYGDDDWAAQSQGVKDMILTMYGHDA